MARKYGGLQGEKLTPSASTAPGSWVAPTEASREKSVGKWPISLPPGSPVQPVGSVVFALTSGVVDTALDSNTWLVADGSNILITEYSDLFEVIGDKFGGDGIVNFNLPKCFDGHIYFKGTTTSGIYPLGSGTLGEGHIHTWRGYRSNTGPDRNRTGNEQAAAAGPSIVVHASTTFGGIQNELRKREFVPIICSATTSSPVGSVVPFLWPGGSGELLSWPTSILIASGQDVSRTTYSNLFSLVGTHYGSGDGSTTFTLPDLRGLFLSGSRQDYSDGFQPSGVIPGSGFLPDCFTTHYHLFEGGNWTGQQGGASQESRTNQATTPQSGISNGLADSESRADNISVIWTIIP